MSWYILYHKIALRQRHQARKGVHTPVEENRMKIISVRILDEHNQGKGWKSK